MVLGVILGAACANIFCAAAAAPVAVMAAPAAAAAASVAALAAPVAAAAAAPVAMMAAPGAAGLLISRAAFEANPQLYFELLRNAGVQAAVDAFAG